MWWASTRFALQPGKPAESVSQLALHLGRAGLAFRVGRIGQILVLDRDHDSPAIFPIPVLPQICSDAEQPAPKRRVTPPPLERPEGLEKGLLNQVVEIRGFGPDSIEVASECRRMSLNQLGRRTLVSRAVRGDENGVGPR